MSAAKDEFPVETFAEAYEYLRRPFTPAAVKFKIQHTFDDAAICVSYIDARLVAGRLNLVCPSLWSPEYVQHPSGQGLICKLTVDGITRTDYGSASNQDEDVTIKGHFSDALKRAAVHFGVGESLYVLPKMQLREGSHLKKGGNGKFRLTDAGQGELRNRYTHWLEQGGKTAFGEPLDHGDVAFEEPDVGEVLADLIAQADFNADQVNTIRSWARNGSGLDPAKADKARYLLLANEPEVLLERAEAAAETKEPAGVS